MTILFRADSSSTIGTGHIMRDLVLAKQYSKSNIIFATRELKGNINHKIIEEGYILEILSSNDIEELDLLIKKYNSNMIVIDHYGIDYNDEKSLKETNPLLKIMVLDDTYEKHHCDIILNHNISADVTKYKKLVPKKCELRCGVNYTLLREEFIKEKNKKTIFLAMGGADHSNINIDILEVLKEFSNIDVILVTTTANQNLEQLREYVKDKDWIKLYINSNKIAKLMKVSDFAIITPSVTLNEVIFMELPFIAIKTATNQEEIYQYLMEKNYLVLGVFDVVKFKDSLLKRLADV